jgi:3-hydroxyisobutyrate dehydrogenase-like beta-hydroxyacid dehydrogenase
MGKKIFRMGEIGKGQATQLAMNMQIAMIYEGFAEALTLATKLGVDSQQLVSLIEATMVRSGVVEYKAPFVLQRDFTPNFPLRLMHKDIRLTLEAAKEARVKLPGLETVEEVYEMATEDGNKDLDYAATLTLLEKWAGVQVKGLGGWPRQIQFSFPQFWCSDGSNYPRNPCKSAYCTGGPSPPIRLL